jgi:hypothetical protein
LVFELDVNIRTTEGVSQIELYETMTLSAHPDQMKY